MIGSRRELDRGVTTLQAQVRELAADLHELKGETRTWQQSHDVTHQAEHQARVTGRRWLIGTGIAGIASMTAVVALLLDVLAHVH